MYVFIYYIEQASLCYENWAKRTYCLTSSDKRAGVHNVREGRIKRGRATYWFVRWQVGDRGEAIGETTD